MTKILSLSRSDRFVFGGRLNSQRGPDAGGRVSRACCRRLWRASRRREVRRAPRATTPGGRTDWAQRKSRSRPSRGAQEKARLTRGWGDASGTRARIERLLAGAGGGGGEGIGRAGVMRLNRTDASAQQSTSPTTPGRVVCGFWYRRFLRRGRLCAPSEWPVLVGSDRLSVNFSTEFIQQRHVRVVREITTTPPVGLPQPVRGPRRWQQNRQHRRDHRVSGTRGGTAVRSSAPDPCFIGTIARKRMSARAQGRDRPQAQLQAPSANACAMSSCRGRMIGVWKVGGALQRPPRPAAMPTHLERSRGRPLAPSCRLATGTAGAVIPSARPQQQARRRSKRSVGPQQRPAGAGSSNARHRKLSAGAAGTARACRQRRRRTRRAPSSGCREQRREARRARPNGRLSTECATMRPLSRASGTGARLPFKSRSDSWTIAFTRRGSGLVKATALRFLRTAGTWRSRASQVIAVKNRAESVAASGAYCVPPDVAKRIRSRRCSAR